MKSQRTLTNAATIVVGFALVAVVALMSPPASAAPGDWTQVSQTSSAAAYPEIRNIDQPTIAWFGTQQQVLWPEQQTSGSAAYLSALLDAQGRVTTPTTQVLPAWQSLSEMPSLITVSGQRFLSFSGLTPGRTGAQYFATSVDGLAWTIADGSMSATQNAYADYGSDAVDNAGTPVWVGNPGTTSGITWHVGTAPTNPAPAGSDQQYLLGGCCAYSAAIARDAATGAVYSAFYSNSSATTENGIQVGQLLPAAGPFRQAPGSTTITDGSADSISPDQRVAMASRPGGGVFIAYVVGYPSAKAIRVYEVASGRTIDVPSSGDARAVSLTAEPDGRLWVIWNDRTHLKSVHTDPGVTTFGSVGTWRAPRGADTLWKTSAAGTAGGSAVALTATVSSAINVWHTMVVRTLTLRAAPASARRGSSVTFTVTDAGAPVAGAKVRFGGRTAVTSSAGKVTITAPSRAGRAAVTAMKQAYRAGTTVVRVR